MLRPRAGVRLRSTFAASAVVAVALIVVATSMIWIVRGSLTQTIRDSAEQRARDVVAAVSSTGITRNALLASHPGERSVVQVIDPRGKVLIASPEIDGEPALTRARPAPGNALVSVDSLSVANQEPFVIVARGIRTNAGEAIVVVADSLASVNTAVKTVEHFLVIGFPIVLAVVAGSVFFFVGRTLQPVEAIRRRVASISGADLAMRVPVPAAHDEVGRLASTMNSMLDRLERSQAAQRRFVADASHELRSPLAALRATVEVGSQHPGAQTWATSAPVILEETDRLDQLVNDLLLLARSDELGRLDDQHDVDLDDIMAAEVTRLRRAGVQVRSNITAAQVTGDLHLLERLARNLCDNAARYAESVVTLSCMIEGHSAVMVVQDDGPGIAEMDRERVFDRFVRLDRARDRDSGGSGLGLAIVARVTGVHGGTVAVEDAKPGARFVVTLPLHKP